jgi:hypothetical protein
MINRVCQIDWGMLSGKYYAIVRKNHIEHVTGECSGYDAYLRKNCKSGNDNIAMINSARNILMTCPTHMW